MKYYSQYDIILTENNKGVNGVINTKHQGNDRKSRQELIDNVIGRGNIIDRFIVDRGHPNGAEIHNVTDTGIIIIQNLNTEKLVTMLIARPHQIMRYYKDRQMLIPDGLVDIAYKHYLQGYNEM